MADKPCRWVHGHDPDDILCTHPLGRHWCPEGLGLGMPILDTTCHGCPCHEPQPDPTPAPASRFVQVACWCERCDLDANMGMATRMALCPECGDKRCSRAEWHENECSTNRPTPTGGKTGHDKP